MRKPFVYRKHLFSVINNQGGFLLIEHLIGLIITSLLVYGALILLTLIQTSSGNPTKVSQHEIETLTTRIQKEVRLAESLSSTSKAFRIHYPNETITYSAQNQHLVRQVTGKGGEVALYHCSKLISENLTDQAARLSLTTEHKETFTIYVSTLTLPLEVKESEEILSLEDESEATNQLESVNEMEHESSLASLEEVEVTLENQAREDALEEEVVSEEEISELIEEVVDDEE